MLRLVPWIRDRVSPVPHKHGGGDSYPYEASTTFGILTKISKYMTSMLASPDVSNLIAKAVGLEESKHWVAIHNI